MPRTYFHLYEGADLLPDTEGREADPGHVADIALREARSLMSAGLLDGVLDFDRRIRVTDAAGGELHVLRFADAVTIVRDGG